MSNKPCVIEITKLISSAIESSYANVGSVSDQTDLLNLAAESISGSAELSHLDMLIAAARSEIISVFSARSRGFNPSQSRAHNEYRTVQFWFKNNHSKLFLGSSLSSVSAGRYRPDFMLKTGDELIPVECKKVFTAAGVRQLLTYIDHFGSGKGIAVASKFSCEIPREITAINISDYDSAVVGTLRLEA